MGGETLKIKIMTKPEASTASSVFMALGFMKLSGRPSLECQAALCPCCWTCSGRCHGASCQGNSCIWVLGTFSADVAIFSSVLYVYVGAS